jgi:hypothetical protein
VRQYLFIQHSLREFEVKLVSPVSSSHAALAAEVVAEFRRLLGEDAQVKVTMCGEIPRSADKKYRYIVSHAKPQWWTDPGSVEREGGVVGARLP